MQLEAALGMLLGGMQKPQGASENNEEGNNETGNNAEEKASETELPDADKQTESNMSVESVDSTAPVTIGKKRRRGSIKKTEGLKLENKDSNLSLDIKVSSKL